MGSNNTVTANIKLTQVEDRGSYALSINNMTTEGYSAKSDNDETDPYSKTEVRLVMDRNISEQLTLGATA